LENGLQISQTESIEKARFYETSNKNQVYNHAFLTVEMCMTQCSFNGFPYAGLIDAFSINASFTYFYNIYFLLFHSFFSSWCACGKTLNEKFKAVGDSYCSYPCIGSRSEKCGAFEYYSIYSTDGSY
jgi:hypothetical protein